jgi:hypothetical protein
MDWKLSTNVVNDPVWSATTPRDWHLQVTDLVRVLEHQPARYMWIAMDPNWVPVEFGHEPTVEAAQTAAISYEQQACTH